jgi:TolB-like protein/Tfp pilus assembly protein PilF
MKKCSQCNRAYFDETLNYCLDDGTSLVYAPSTEPQTAILPGVLDVAETSTKTLGETDAEPAGNEQGGRQGRSGRALISVFAIVVLIAGGFLGYRYLGAKNTKQIDSVAVMPFVNESGNPDIEYLSDGITESLISSLSRLPNLTVKPRSTVFRYKGKNTDAAALGKELNVMAILNGTVAQRGADTAMHVELIDTALDTVLWSADYKRPLSDLAALQSEIARDVSTRLKSKLSGFEQRQLTSDYASNTGAYQLYLKGKFYSNKRTKNDINRSIEYFDQAVAADPDYAPAYAGLADVYRYLPGFDPLISSRDSAIKARENARKALSLNDELAEAHMSIGSILQDIDYDFAGAEREFKRAIDLEPNNGAAHASYAHLMATSGRTDEAAVHFKRALELEPVSVTISRSYGNFLMLTRRYDESLEQAKKTLELDPTFVLGYFSLANVYQLQGKYAETAESYAKSQDIRGNTQGATLIRESFAKGGWKGLLRTMVEAPRLTEMRPPYIRGTYYSWLGEKDKALDELEKAYEERSTFIPILKIDPRLDPLRNEPRFQQLVKKVGFPE